MKNTRGSEWNKWDLHIHTASSYDSPYKADDADELLCQALAENDIKAVAITDHFKIDKTRIEHLRKLAPEIVFFPGVELRTDKGANNLHLILIFSELSDLETLSADFNAIMLRTLAKSKESDETIYWQFDDIVEFSELQEFLDVPLKNYSSGMVARLAFAVATMTKPDILIADEILSVGDFLFQEKCEKRMAELLSGGTTVILVSHSIEQIERMCNKVAWLDHGHLRRLGPTKEVTAEYRKFEKKDAMKADKVEG